MIRRWSHTARQAEWPQRAKSLEYFLDEWNLWATDAHQDNAFAAAYLAAALQYQRRAGLTKSSIVAFNHFITPSSRDGRPFVYNDETIARYTGLPLRGVGLLTAVILAAEIGDYARFRTARQLMGYLGMVPSEASTGRRRHQGRITRTGNGHVRRILVEASWNYRFRPRVSKAIRQRRELVSAAVRQIAEKAEARLSRRYQALTGRGKDSRKVAMAVARELAGFVWAIAREVNAVAV